MKANLVGFISSRFSKSPNRKFLSFARFAAFMGIVFGTMALILSISILSGFEKELRSNAIKFTSHIILTSYSSTGVKDYSEKIELIKNTNQSINKCFPVIEREGLIKSKTYTDGASIRGIGSDASYTGAINSLITGVKTFSADTAKEVIIGSRMASKMNVKTGDFILLFSILKIESGNIPESKAGRYKIVGIYETGMASYDDLVVFIPYENARRFFGFEKSDCSKIEIYLNDINQVGATAKNIEQIIGSPIYCQTYYEIHRAIFSWIEIQKEPIPLVLGIISLVAALNIITALLISVVEKTTSIGILRSLGLRNGQIIMIFAYQGLSVGIAGAIIGAAISYLFTIIQRNYHIIRLKGEIYFLDSLPISAELNTYLWVIGLTCALSLLASLAPARIATKISPVKALKFK